MKYFFLILVTMTILSCTRGYYNTTQDYYDYNEAYELIQGLKEGILIVQIPYEKRKLEILKRIYENETNAEKQVYLKDEYESYLSDLRLTQYKLVEGLLRYYKFSQYALVPDTLINEFKKGVRKNIFLNNDLSLGKEVNIDTSKTIMFLRDLRDYDNLFIHKFDGSYPPSPFPYTSQGTFKDIDIFDLDTAPDDDVKNEIMRAVYAIDKRLEDFYSRPKPSN